MSYDIHFMKLRRPVSSSKEIGDGDFGPIDTVAAIRTHLDALFPSGVEWFDEKWGETRTIPWAQWKLLLTDDRASVIWVTLRTSGRISGDERYELAQRVADATGRHWTSDTDHAGVAAGEREHQYQVMDRIAGIRRRKQWHGGRL